MTDREEWKRLAEEADVHRNVLLASEAQALARAEKAEGENVRLREALKDCVVSLSSRVRSNDALDRARAALKEPSDMAEREQAEAIRTAVEQEIANWHEREIKRIQDHWEEHKPKYVAAGGDAVRHIADLVKWHRSAATAISSGAYRKPAQGDAR